MRVIAGKYRSRPLHSLRGMDIRPTSDRMRETLFNVLASGNPSALEGSVWLDLFAGSGAVGIEALSRGAREVYFAENSRAAAELIRRNLHGLGIQAGFNIVEAPALHALSRFEQKKITADVVFLDPPYRMADGYQSTLSALARSSLIGPMSVVIAEHERQYDPGEGSGGLRRYRRLEQGSAALSFYRLGGSAENAEGVAGGALAT